MKFLSMSVTIVIGDLERDRGGIVASILVVLGRTTLRKQMGSGMGDGRGVIKQCEELLL